MLHHSLSGLDRNKLRWWLLLFFLALAIPTAVLVRQTYSQLKWEAFHQHRVLAEELSGRIDNSISQLIRREASRSFSDYRFLVVAGDPTANLVQRSPLSIYPVAGDIPGLIGYFQVDSDGAFSSPLMPERAGDPARYGIAPQELQQRQALATRLQTILGQNRLVSANETVSVARTLAGRPGVQGLREQEGDSTQRYSHSAVPPGKRRAAPAPAGEPAGQALFDQLGKTSPARQKRSQSQLPGALGRVEDLKLEEQFEAVRGAQQPDLDEAPQPAGEKRGARTEYSTLAENDAAPSGTPALRIQTFESAIDPFEFSLLDSGHFVLFRKVWRDGQRHIQGMLIEPQPWLNGLIETAFRDTGLSQMSDLIVAFGGDVLAAFSGDTEYGYLSSAEQLTGALLYRTHLSAPLGDLEMIYTVTRLPAAPGAALVNWLAAILALVLCAGFYLMYRLGSRQIELARQQQDFVSAVSHELKTPLTSIRMYGEMLREGWAPEEKKKSYYAFIHDESERLSRLIGNVLQLARMTRNELHIACKPVRVSVLMEDVRSRVISQIEHAGFELNISIEQDAQAAVIDVDADNFTQILINLVDNAVKFAARAERKIIDISCQRLQDNQIQFAVRDFGPGVPPDQIKKIFRLFYRPGNELTRETVGTGIGLALVQQLAVAMHGKVDVVNRQPGAEFRVLFRAAAND